MKPTNTKIALCFFFLASFAPPSESAQALPFPRVDLQASATLIPRTGSIRLTWATTNVSRCEARGDWYGEREVNGGWNLNGLERNHEYELVCVGPGGTAIDSVSVAVSDAATPPDSPNTPPVTPPENEQPDTLPTTPSSPPGGNQPWVDLRANAPSIPIGGSVRLSWSSQNVSRCQAGNAWAGEKETDGGWNLNYLARTHTYSLTCTGAAGQVTDSVTVFVGESAPSAPIGGSGGGSDSGSGSGSGNDSGSGGSPTIQPTVTLQASEVLLNSGDTTRLSWSSNDASTCRAMAGPWSGIRGTSGSESSARIYGDTTFSIECSNGDQTAISMITVSVQEQMVVRWRPPTENVDGSPLTDLAGYRIYYGTARRSYQDYVEVRNPSRTDFSFTLPSGSYLVAMTSIDSEGNESAYSNEVRLSTR